MPRFTISRHVEPSGERHYDLFLEKGDCLETWSLRSTDFQILQSARRLGDHRPIYLEYEGPLSDDRGEVKVWDTGEYMLDATSAIHVRLGLSGKKTACRICLDRRMAEPGADAEWLLYDASERLRFFLVQHFRQDPLPEPDSDILLEIRDQLVTREKEMTTLADAFIRGKAVDWGAAHKETGLTVLIREQRARWVHPWLVPAYRFAMRIDRWARHIRAYQMMIPPEELKDRTGISKS